MSQVFNTEKPFYSLLAKLDIRGIHDFASVICKAIYSILLSTIFYSIHYIIILYYIILSLKGEDSECLFAFC